MPRLLSAGPLRGGTLLLLLALVPGAGLRATIVGLNQIVTPDIQPAGVLAVSAQAQHATIGNSQEIQFELGVTPRFEAGIFQGLKPDESVAAAEFNLLQDGPHLLTAGVVNWSTRGGGAQPVLEYGYYNDSDHYVAGGLEANGQSSLLLGYKHTVSDKLAFSADFQSGSTGSATVGFTWNFTPEFSINPAVYRTNARPHHLLGYVVVTWNFTLWK
ncbi:MAG TPA: hypothetical protein VHD61_10460 [Lacunisphaera sp.]|nr:hypothetical protein [Lacunisphaera sp.]